MLSNTEPRGEALSPPPTPFPFQEVKPEHGMNPDPVPPAQIQAGEDGMDMDEAPRLNPKNPPAGRPSKNTYRGQITMAQILEHTKPGVKCSSIARKLAEAMKVKNEEYFILPVEFRRNVNGSEKQINLRRPENVVAVLMQMTGDIHSDDESCIQCQNGKGFFLTCKTSSIAGSGSCANCHYGTKGTSCSLRAGQKSAAPRRNENEEVQRASVAPKPDREPVPEPKPGITDVKPTINTMADLPPLRPQRLGQQVAMPAPAFKPVLAVPPRLPHGNVAVNLQPAHLVEAPRLFAFPLPCNFDVDSQRAIIRGLRELVAALENDLVRRLGEDGA